MINTKSYQYKGFLVCIAVIESSFWSGKATYSINFSAKKTNPLFADWFITSLSKCIYKQLKENEERLLSQYNNNNNSLFCRYEIMDVQDISSTLMFKFSNLNTKEPITIESKNIDNVIIYANQLIDNKINDLLKNMPLSSFVTTMFARHTMRYFTF